MKIHCTTVWLEKNGITRDEYEDAFAPVNIDLETDSSFRCAVADGATEASFSREWAQLLVSDFVNSVPIDSTRATFQKQIDGLELDWFAQQKAEMGSFAAIIGLALQPDMSWSAMSIGDCELFHIRGQEIISRFPHDTSSLFNNSPELCSTLAQSGCRPKQSSGKWQHNDEFWLSSDALAMWILQQCESGSDGWQQLKDLQSRDDVERFAHNHRGHANPAKFLRNDDLTLMRIFVST